MGVSKCPAGLNPDLRHLAPLKHPAALQLLLQATPVDQLHGVVRDLPIEVIPQQLHDVRVIELEEGLDLDLESLPEIGLRGERAGENLDSRRLVGLDVNPLIDRSHPPATQRPHDAIRPELLRFHRRVPLPASPNPLS